MRDRDERDEDPVIGAAAIGGTGGQALVPGTPAYDPYDDPNGPVPDNEETHDAAEEDDVLFDSGDSPEFDHSLRRYKRQ